MSILTQLDEEIDDLKEQVRDLKETVRWMLKDIDYRNENLGLAALEDSPEVAKARKLVEEKNA